jgi:hypothetical protein
MNPLLELSYVFHMMTQLFFTQLIYVLRNRFSHYSPASVTPRLAQDLIEYRNILDIWIENCHDTYTNISFHVETNSSRKHTSLQTTFEGEEYINSYAKG